jgi:uncharacterized protein with GYD domain
LIFISLAKATKKPSKQSIEEATRIMDDLKNQGIKVIGWYWTLGRYDYALIFEARDEKEALKTSLAAADFMSIETLTAISRDEALKLL